MTGYIIDRLTIRVFASVSHREETGAGVAELAVGELVPISLSRGLWSQLTSSRQQTSHRKSTIRQESGFV